MNIEERVDRVEKRFDGAEKRNHLIEHAILQIRDLLISHDNRLDDYYKALWESRDDFNFKLNALINTQMENEAGVRELRESTKELRDVSRSHLTRIENLENKIDQ